MYVLLLFYCTMPLNMFIEKGVESNKSVSVSVYALGGDS